VAFRPASPANRRDVARPGWDARKQDYFDLVDSLTVEAL